MDMIESSLSSAYEAGAGYLSISLSANYTIRITTNPSLRLLVCDDRDLASPNLKASFY